MLFPASFCWDHQRGSAVALLSEAGGGCWHRYAGHCNRLSIGTAVIRREINAEMSWECRSCFTVSPKCIGCFKRNERAADETLGPPGPEFRQSRAGIGGSTPQQRHTVETSRQSPQAVFCAPEHGDRLDCYTERKQSHVMAMGAQMVGRS